MSSDLPGLIRFLEEFPDEQTCWEHLRDARWPTGFVCPMCGEDEDWTFLEKRERWHCYPCGHQASVTSQTVLENTNLDLRTWFLGAYLVFTIKKGISSHELARKLEIHQESAWYMKQRLSLIAGPYARRLFGVVEVDEAYIGGVRGETEKGRSTAKAPVVGAVEDKGDSAGSLMIMHVDNARGETIDPVVEDSVDRDALVRTDGFAAYHGFAERTGYEHEMTNLSQVQEAAHEVFPWIHVVWSNLKRFLGGVLTKASRAHLQDYLDLYQYRFEHRSCLEKGLAQGLAGLALVPRVTRRQLKGGVLAEVH